MSNMIDLVYILMSCYVCVYVTCHNYELVSCSFIFICLILSILMYQSPTQMNTEPFHNRDYV